MKNSIHLKYPAVFEVGTDGISILFPDIPECISCAFSKRQAKKMAKEALTLALHGVRIDELPAQKYPLKRFSSKTLFIRPIAIKIQIRDHHLFDNCVVEFPELNLAPSSESENDNLVGIELNTDISE